MTAQRWFKHGKWPKKLVNIHYYSIVSFVLLLVTGILLFTPVLHAQLIPYLKLLLRVHIALGIIFAVTLLTPFVARLPLGKLIRRLDWWFPMVFGAGIVVTGVMLWISPYASVTWISTSFRWHGWLSYVLAGWLVVHGTYKAFSYRPARQGVNAQLDPERRMFVRWLSAGLAGTLLLVVLDPVKGLARVATGTRKTTAVQADSAFAAYYTVTGNYPSIHLSDYKLTVDGLVSKPVELSFTDIQQLPGTDETRDFHCVTGWSAAGVQWSGVHLKSIMNVVSPHAQVRFVHFYSQDGAYTESLSLAEATDPSVMLAYRMNGAHLPVQQGFPLRLVVPKMFGYKSIKWVNRIEFSDQPLTGYWEARGYSSEAWVGTL